jgi:hypothetical protein
MTRTQSFAVVGASVLFLALAAALWSTFGGEVYFAYLAGAFLACF